MIKLVQNQWPSNVFVGFLYCLRTTALDSVKLSIWFVSIRWCAFQAVFYFVFCHPNAPDSFEITTNFPKRVLKCRPENKEMVETLEQAGLKNREVLFINDLDA